MRPAKYFKFQQLSSSIIKQTKLDNSLIVILRTKKLREFCRIKCCSQKVNSNVQNHGMEMAEIYR